MSDDAAAGAAVTAQDFSSFYAPLQEQIKSLVTQPATQTGVRRIRAFACEEMLQAGGALSLLQWSMFRLADGRILFSDDDPLQLQGEARFLRLRYARANAGDTNMALVDISSTMEGAPNEITGWAPGVVSPSAFTQKI